MVRGCLAALAMCLVSLAATGSHHVAAAAPITPAQSLTATAGQLIISEFRLHGPGANATAQAANEFIEIYNATTAPHTVASLAGIGYGIATSDGFTRCTIPNGTVIPAHGHFLCVNNSYSLTSYPAGNGTTATGDTTYTTEIPINTGIAIFNNNSGGASYTLANRLDAVGSSSEANAVYKEGAGYSPLVALPIQGSLARKTAGMCSDAACTGGNRLTPVSSSALVDTGDNASDFYFSDTDGTNAGFGQRLGVPGPENLSSPIMLDGSSSLVYQKASGCSARDASPNRVRDLTSDPGNNSFSGTLDLRTTWKNVSGANITRLRFRVIDLSTFPAGAGVADLRPRTAAAASIVVDTYPCGTGTSTLTVQGTTLEQPPSQPNGSGFNGSLSAGTVTAGTPLANNSSISVRFLLGIQQTGLARFCVIPETLPAVAGDPFCYIGSTEATTTPAPGDFDDDQKAEMPMYNPATGQWKILKSSSGFAAETLLSWGGAGYKAVPGDYDGDGRYDAAVYNTISGDWSILTSSSNFTRALNIEKYGASACDPTPGDYDGDGTTDISVSCPISSVWAFLASSHDFGLSVAVGFGDPGITPLGGYDFDGDHRSDMVGYRENTGQWYVLTSNTNFSAYSITGWGGRGYTPVPGDYDGDGRADYAVYQRSTGTWSVLKSIGGYTSVLSKGWGGPGYLPVPADFDGDHKLDIVVYQPAATRWLALKSSTSYTTVLQAVYGTSGDMPITTAVLPRSMPEVDAGDFSGDSISDLTVYNTSSGVWSTLRSEDAFEGATNRSWGGSGYTPVPGDYDGDGRGDLGVYQASTGQWLILNSSFGFTTSYSFNAGGAGYIPVPGDYDGDGRADMVVYNTTTGLWYGRKSSSNFTTTISVGWGGTGYTAAPGDFDGDGRLDLALYQASSGNWLILKSSSNYTTSITRNFGGAGYAPVPADFDGDGITDFAVYQSATGVWTMLKSSTGNTAGFTVSYGGPGYTPVAGDWDADGRAEAGVYNDATGAWSILLSSSAYTTSLSKNWGGVGYAPVPHFP